MLTAQVLEAIRSFPDFVSLPAAAAGELAEVGQVARVSARDLLACQGEACNFFPVVLSGAARIYSMDAEGHEITLYRLGPGDGCVLAAACSLSGLPLPGFAVVDEAGEGLFVPAPVFRAWVTRHEFWQNYFYSLVARQLARVVASTNMLAFQRVDARVAGFLLQQARERTDGTVRATHHDVAMEVGSRREVVSRILKDLERSGTIALSRGTIRVVDQDALAEHAAPIAKILARSNAEFSRVL